MSKSLQKGAFAQRIGTSRGDRTSKVHGLTDAAGHRARPDLTGQHERHDDGARTDGGGQRPLRPADRGYDANAIRTAMEQNAEVVIPSTPSRKVPIPYNRDAYRARNLVYRLWCRLQDWRRIAAN